MFFWEDCVHDGQIQHPVSYKSKAMPSLLCHPHVYTSTKTVPVPPQKKKEKKKQDLFCPKHWSYVLTYSQDIPEYFFGGKGVGRRWITRYMNFSN